MAEAREATLAAEWGVEPIPTEQRPLAAVEVFVLWFNLGVSLLLLVAGALLVPGLGLRDALLATVVGAVLGNLLLGVAAWIGAEAVSYTHLTLPTNREV